MPICKQCGDEVDELVTVTTDGKRRRVCESCASEADSASAVAEESEAVVQRMMEFKGRR
ncbi:MAG: hypothetical protein JW751_20840 [Polyangiaceae bacterium]|nr:hypothetical protein [Polyangiaceae bacterium]